MSGTPLGLRALPPPVSEFAYSSVVQALGLEKLAGSDRVKKLLEVPVDDFLAKVPPSIPLLPVADDLLPGTLTFKQVGNKHEDPVYTIPGQKWCKDLLIGDCKFDVRIRATTLRESFI